MKRRGYLKPTRRSAKKSLQAGYTPNPARFPSFAIVAPVLAITGITFVTFGFYKYARRLGWIGTPIVANTIQNSQTAIPVQTSTTVPVQTVY